jgi:hypothetical protein
LYRYALEGREHRRLPAVARCRAATNCLRPGDILIFPCALAPQVHLSQVGAYKSSSISTGDYVRAAQVLPTQLAGQTAPGTLSSHRYSSGRNETPCLTETLLHLCSLDLRHTVRPHLPMPNQTPCRADLPIMDRQSHHVPGTLRAPRRAVRYTLDTQVVYSWSDVGGLPRESRGCTRDISPKGSYVIAACCPPLGTTLAMSFDLPALMGESQAVHVQVHSRVTRIDPGGAGRCAGFSVENVRTTLCPR